MKRVAVILAVLAAVSCSPKIVERVVVQRDTMTVHHRDTTYRRDSIYIREWIKGDTVFVTKFRDRYVFRDRWRDSIVVRVDSFAVETVREVEVEKPLTAGQKARIGAFWWLVLAVLGLGAWTFRKPLGGLVTKLWKMIF